MTAPVDLREPSYRTLLLGMKHSSEYHLRVVATDGHTTLTSDDYTIVTGPLVTGLPEKFVETADGAELSGGFTVTSLMISDTAIILDEDGDYVWWYEVPGLPISRARLTSDGKYMLMGAINVRDADGGAIYKVRMDGMEEAFLDTPDRHHDFTILPEGDIIAYIEFDKEGVGTCDRIVELGPDGTKDVIYTLRDDFAHRAVDSEWCHSNAINYVPREDAYYLSVLQFNGILKIDRSTRKLVWILGGPESTFEGADWNGQHQHHVLESSILLFNNAGGVSEVSNALELTIDEAAGRASRIWSYSSDVQSRTLGDVQRLWNGNTMIAYSNAGTIHEVDGGGFLQREIVFALGGAVGYAIRRPTLYGPPPD
jgi:hypothetical protein